MPQPDKRVSRPVFPSAPRWRGRGTGTRHHTRERARIYAIRGFYFVGIGGGVERGEKLVVILRQEHSYSFRRM